MCVSEGRCRGEGGICVGCMCLPFNYFTSFYFFGKLGLRIKDVYMFNRSIILSVVTKLQKCSGRGQ